MKLSATNFSLPQPIALFLTAGLLLSVACKHKLTPAETTARLEKVMTQHLEQKQKENPIKANFKVVDVAWFAERNYYRCSFTVKMTLPNGRDTTGIMTERISKDFSTFDVPIEPGR